MKARRTAVIAAAALVTTCLVAASGRQSMPSDQAMLLTHGDRAHYGSVRFTLAGQPVTGLYPGATRQIKVTVTNPFEFALALRSLNGRVAGTARRACAPSAANLRVGDYTGRLPIIIKPYARLTLPGAIPVTMPRGATPKCADTRFTIALAGAGGKVGR